ncbi:MAG TPA: hypothetical protein VHQ65_07785 [Thermoanaerobaculia bacterium]|nr:hypothetical protein [Thermoanaerobaculia bacterium]
MILTPFGPALLALLPRLVGEHPLRGADAVHLASALSIRDAGIEVVFAVADARLSSAGEAEGLTIFDPLPA